MNNPKLLDAEKGPSAQVATDDESLIMVGWDGPEDPLNPANATVGRKLVMTFLVSLIAISVTAASAIDASGVLQYSEYFNVSDVVGSLATGRWPFS